MKTQFEKMMLSIKTDKLLTEIYDIIDKNDGMGYSSCLFELSGEDVEELVENVLISLRSNLNISSAEAYTSSMSDGLFINIAWEQHHG